MHRPNRRRAPLIALAMVMALGLGACGDDDDDEAAQTTETTTAQVQGSDTVTIEMADFTYTVSGPLNAGGTIRLSNVGKEFHVMALGRFKPGKTIQDLQTALSQMGPGGPEGGGGPPTTATGGGTTTSSARGTTTSSARGGTTTTSAAGGGATGGEEEERPDPFADIFEGETGLPGGFMSPGESVEVTVPNLQPGTYGLICFIPSEEEGTPHLAKGMINELIVVAGPTPPQPTADATYRLAAGQAIQGPATLTPGRHTLKFEAAAGSHQLEPGIARLNRGATVAQLDAAVTRIFENEDQPPPRGAASQVPGQFVFSGLDLHEVTTFYVTVDLKAGDYVLVAEDTDEQKTGTPKEVLILKVG